MDCAKTEERLSEYMESGLPPEAMEQVAQHLNTCARCSALFEEMRSAVSLCRSFPVLEPDLALVDRILLRTSGRPRRRSLRELLKQYLVGPLLTPRFAAGAGLAALFVFLLAGLVAPRVPAALSALSPAALLQLMDRGVQQLYGQGLKAYEKKNEFQAQAANFKNNVLNKLRFMIERIEAPIEGKRKSEEPAQRKERAPGEKSSGPQFSAPQLEIDCS